MSSYVAIRSEGGLIPPDTLDKIAKEEMPGQKASDFGLPGGQRLSDEIARAWSHALDYWSVFQRRREELPEADVGTTLTRRWVTHLLDEVLGYQLDLLRTAPQIEGRPYPFSHRAEPTDDAPPLHVVGFRQDLDHRPESGHRRMSPQALVQEYLNRTEQQLWGVVTNGLRLRLLRDSTRSTRPTYLEFDLESILSGQRFSEFALVFRICHRTRLPKTSDDAASCLLEQYYQASIEEGARVREHLRDGVEDALKLLGTGLLRHPGNDRLREAVATGALTEQAYYQQLLRLIYRLLFLMVAEERRMIVAQGKETEQAQRIYDDHYSVRRLRDRAEQLVESGTYGDLWIGLQQAFRLFDSSDNALGIPPLNGDLFGSEAIPDLEGTDLHNHVLLVAIRHLSLFAVRGVRQRVNYAGLDVEELGSVYESLLDFQPAVRQAPEGMEFDLPKGMERKSTGSYYTHPDLVGELIKSALVPVMEDRLAQARTREEKEKALLGLTVCDPASGSGHFLLAAARRIGRELARARTGEDEPTPEEFRRAVRDVIRHCIYGVDVNPLAVDLCKLALWIEGHNVGLPLTFLDHRVKCGNSLIGIFNERPPEVPDAAFTPVTGDVGSVATAVRRRNREERKPSVIQQLGLLEEERVGDDDVETYAQVARLPDDDPAGVHEKRRRYEDWQQSESHRRAKLEADIWCAAFFWPLTESDGWMPTNRSYLVALSKPSSVPAEARAKIEALAERHHFFHWCLEFPDVFARGGFDVVLGNPPWERIKLQQQEFFAARDPEIARAPNKAARERMIKQLRNGSPRLHAEYEAALHDAEAEGRFLRQSGRFPLGGRGDINTYALFTEVARVLLNEGGRAGIIVPPGIATDDTTKTFFSDLIGKRSLVSLLGMDNEAMIYFAGIDHRNKFALVTLAGPGGASGEPVFTFACSRLEYTMLAERRFALTHDDIALLNPNTRTCPVFRTRVDAELTKAIYQRVPVLVREARNGRPEENPWQASLRRVFDMNRSDVLALCTDRPCPDNCPILEAKTMHQFDHRWATYDGCADEDTRKGLARDLTDNEKRDPDLRMKPRYWISEEEVLLRTARVPPGLIQGIRLKDERMVGAALLTWVASYHYNSGNEESAVQAAAKMLPSATHLGDLANFLAVVGEQHEYPLTEQDMLAIQHFNGDTSTLFPLAWMLIRSKSPRWLIGFRDVTSNVVERTTIAASLPRAGTDFTIRVLSVRQDAALTACLLANLNAFTLDYCARQKVGGSHLADFLTKQLPVLPPDRYTRSGLDFVVPRVLELTYTAWDLRPFAEDLGYEGPPFIWNPERRAILRAELDAHYAHLYGLNRKHLRYILDPHGLSAKELEDILAPWEDPTCSGPHLLPAEPALDFPGETFRVLKEKEEKLYGEYRTRRLVLDAWERLHADGMIPRTSDAIAEGG